MRIFFDHEAFNSKAYGGGGRVFCDLIAALTDLPNCEVDWFAGAYRTPLPLRSVARNCRHFYGLRTPPLGPLRRMIEPAVEPIGRWCLDHSGADVYHLTYYHPLKSRRKIARVITIHDMIHERFPQYFPGDPTTGNRRAALRDAAAVVCVSAATRDRLLELYPETAEKTSVILSASSLQLPAGAPPPRAGEKPYVLYVGNRGRYKNFGLLLEACSRLAGFGPDFTLKCFGGEKLSPDEQKVLAERGLASSVEQFAGDDAMLAGLYRDAICLVYPSLEEGFGLPLLEGMNCGCALLASRIPPFEEVAAEAAIYFDPTSVEELTGRLREMIEQPEQRQELIRAGTRRAALFSWKRCAAEYYEVYSRVVS
jgi:glycosyltransferase involved in cell wall biosynthesis